MFTLEWLWKPRSWQKELYESSHPKCIVKACRRSGKTEIIMIEALQQGMAGKNVLLMAPYKVMVQEVHRRLREYLHKHDLHDRYVVRDSAAPIPLIQFKNGGRIKGFTANGVSFRGQECDVLLCDEADYFPDGALERVEACLKGSEHPRSLLVSSPVIKPPEEPHSEFRRLYESGDYKTFHWPYTVLSQEIRDAFEENKDAYTSEDWTTEVLAEWI